MKKLQNLRIATDGAQVLKVWYRSMKDEQGLNIIRVRCLKAVRLSLVLKALAVNVFRIAALRLDLEGKKEPSFVTCLVFPD